MYVSGRFLFSSTHADAAATRSLPAYRACGMLFTVSLEREQEYGEVAVENEKSLCK